MRESFGLEGGSNLAEWKTALSVPVKEILGYGWFQLEKPKTWPLAFSPLGVTHTVSAGGLEVKGALGRYLRRKNRSQTAVNRCRDNSNLERPSYLVRYRRDKEGDIGNMPTKVSLYHLMKWCTH